jgi:hypothetical protein
LFSKFASRNIAKMGLVMLECKNAVGVEEIIHEILSATPPKT